MDQLEEITLRSEAIDFSKMKNTWRWHGELQMDSLDDVEMIMAIEDLFGVEISDEEAAKMDTIGDTLKFLNLYGHQAYKPNAWQNHFLYLHLKPFQWSSDHCG